MPDDLSSLLPAAVSAVGGSERPGQVRMAQAVAAAVESGEHLLVQAGTGTGKSLAYLVPAIAHAVRGSKPVVVATATLALQAQVVDRDLPRIAAGLQPILGRRATYGMIKGRRNYLCRHKLDGGFPDEEDTLFGGGATGGQTFSVARSQLGEEVVRLREWADETETGDRDELVPGVSERAWRQVSVSAHECLGGKCPMVLDCFVEQARTHARESDVVVTNHSMLAIDAFEGRQILPEHDLVVIDEAHELVDRVTSTVTDEVTAGTVERAARRATKHADVSALEDAASMLGGALGQLPDGRLRRVPEELLAALAGVRDAARSVLSEMKADRDSEADGSRQVARAAVTEVLDCASRVLEERPGDVAWVSVETRRGPVLRVAPIGVAGLLRDRLFEDRSVVLTSATLELGGSFDSVAGAVGLKGESAPAWTGLDVGSPFDYPKQGMLYVARHLPQPGRDGIAPETLDELADLVTAAGGRTLGLFSSMRAAQTAAEAMRERLDVPVLCQGEDQTATLVREFSRDARTCLFGTLSLWQGVDVPGPACQLVVIDRIPFPRPDDPLQAARSEAVAKAGGNGFMAVSATHAALRLAQGAGRLVRTSDDRGVVAVLDPRLATARYSGFLRDSLPDFWPTTDRDVAVGALRRLDAAAGTEVLPVHEPGSRAEAFRAGSQDVPAGQSSAEPATGAEPLEAADVTHSAAGAVSTGAPVPPSSRTAVVGGRPWSAEEDELLRQGVSLGVTLGELADQFDCSREAVQARLQRLGLEAAADEDDFDPAAYDGDLFSGQ